MIYDDAGLKIRNKALEIGFDQCGIIKIDEVKEYLNQLNEKVADVPNLKPFYDYLGKLGTPEKNFDWAKSIIVCVKNYGRYKVLENLNGIISKFYMFDYKWKSYSEDYQKNEVFDKFLAFEGIKFLRDPVFGVAPSRLCAVKANLGIIRRNNFFYNKNGSWSWIETWVTDKIMEFKEDGQDFEECPEGCNECIKACPTNALCKPYFTNMIPCITRLCYAARGVTPKPFRDKMKTWIFGCDECQNACPKNQGKWDESQEFNYPDDNLKNVTLESILESDFETLEKIFFPVFFYIPKEKSWVWKCNALIAMANSYKPEYEKHILKHSNSDNENIKEVALWAIEKLGLND